MRNDMSTDTAALLALASRVEAGERTFAIECEIAKALGDGRMPPPNVTVSVDAVESLRQRLLPGWCIWRLREMPNGTWLCLKRIANTDRENGFAPTIAQAYCAAVLRALAANKETSNDGN